MSSIDWLRDEPLEQMLLALRADDWSVSVHYDYMQKEPLQNLNVTTKWTLWLFTHPAGLFVKGEGATDREAVWACIKAAHEIFKPSP